jgi:hypothetical protein
MESGRKSAGERFNRSFRTGRTAREEPALSLPKEPAFLRLRVTMTRSI